MQRLDIPTEQQKRQQSAEEAMAHGSWEYLPGRWSVEGQDPDRHLHSSLPPRNGCMACSCPDYQRYGLLGLDCKHVCGLRLWLKVQERCTSRPKSIYRKRRKTYEHRRSRS